jgi:hypothetical protein
VEWVYIIAFNTLSPRKIIKMSETKIKFELEKQNKNSVRYKEIPKDGMPPILGSIYVQKWYAGNSKYIEVTINKVE